jgi:hypothetical protein
MLSSCQSLDEFVFITDRMFLSRSSIHSWLPRLGNVDVQEPRMMELVEPAKTDRPWEPVPKDHYLFGRQIGKVSILIAS